MWHSLRAERRHRLRRAHRSLRAPAGSYGRPRTDAVLARLAIASLGVVSFILLLVAAYALATAAALLPAAREASRMRLDLPGIPYTAPRFIDRTGSHLLSTLEDAAHTPYWLAFSPSDDEHAVPPLAAAAICRALTLDCQQRPAGVVAGLTAVAHSLRGTLDVPGLIAEQLAQQSGHDSTFGARARALLAGELASRYSSQHLLEWLINTQLHGRLTRGLDAAALEYFGEHADRLGLSEWAALAALARHPGLAGDVQALSASRDIVVKQLQAGGELGAAAAAEATADRLVLRTEGFSLSPLAADFLSLGRSQLERHELELASSTTPLVVTTSLDSEVQLQALCTAQTALARAQAGASARALPMLDGRDCDAARFLSAVPLARQADLALVVLDVERGELLAYFASARGARGSEASGNAGTAILPFAYLTAFAKGYTPATMVLDVSQVVAETGDPRLAPGNLDGRYMGPMLASDALREGRIVPAVTAMTEVGEENLAQTLSGFGLSSIAASGSDLQNLISQSGRVSLLELTRAYAIFAAGGLDRVGPPNELASAVLNVRDPGGRTVLPAQAREPRLVLSRGLAYLMQEELAVEVIASDGTSAPAGSLASGRSLEGTYHWAFAFTSRLVVGVLTTEQGAPQDPGADLAEPVARAVLAWAHATYPASLPALPPEVSRVRVCSPSGLLPTAACPRVVSEVVISGTEPTTIDSYYQFVAVNRETGRRATIWTPTVLVEEVVFVDPPGAAREWAEANGLMLAPAEYDTLPPTFEAATDLILHSPAPFTTVRGLVEVAGTAATANMTHYWLQAGQGLYPQEWLLVAEGAGPLTSAPLGSWDTATLDGTYSLQLSVSDGQGNLRRMAVPVTVDNRPPEVRLTAPAAEGRVLLARGAVLAAVVEANDNLTVVRVEILLDGLVVARFERGPYSTRWTDLPAGLHTLQARAYDAAGNSAISPTVEVVID